MKKVVFNTYKFFSGLIKKISKLDYLDLDSKVMKNGFVGSIEDDQYFIFCNERNYKGKGFLFECCNGCEHKLKYANTTRKTK